MSSLEENEENPSPRRSSSRKLLIVPSSTNMEEAVQLKTVKELDNGVAPEKGSVLAEPSKTVRVSESYEDAIDRPSKAATEKKKKSWKFWEKDEADTGTKPVPVYQLFRYATWFDWILITISVTCAILNGCTLPGAMYVFGDFTNLFAYHDSSRQIFNNISANYRVGLADFNFSQNSNITTIDEAFSAMTLSPQVLQTNMDIAEVSFRAAGFSFPFSLAPDNVTSIFLSAACVITNYSMEAVDNLTTPFLVLQEIVTNSNYRLKVTENGCSCLLNEIRDFNLQVQCYTDHTFIYGQGGVDGVLWMVYLFLLLALITFTLGSFQVSFIQWACERQVHKIRLAYYRAVLRQDVGWFDLNPSGELSSRLNDDIDKIHDGIGDKFSLLIQWVATFFAGFIFGFVRGWQLALLLVAIAPLLVISATIFSKIAATFTTVEQKIYAGAGAVAEEVLTSVRTVIAFGGEYKEFERYKSKLADARIVGARKGISIGTSLGLIYFVMFCTYAAAFWFGAFLISENILFPGDMLAVFFAVIIAAFSLGQAGPNIENLVTAAGAAGEIFKTIDRTPPIDVSSDEGLIPDKFEPSVKFQDVCFTYPARPEVQVLNGLDLEVKVGQTVALVGSSGCGKSTVVQLLQRFYDISGGQITVSGHDIKELNLKWLRRNIGVVSQEPVLFDTTIAENIRHGREDASLEDIIEAAKAANAHNFISELPDQYNTLCGDRGTQLSGGQKQRVAIARALVRDPKILLLDEATSALDTESEKIVQEALDKAREGRTTIVIAHRLSTIQTANVIAGIDNGRVVEIGTHEELMKNQGLYYELVTAQSYGDAGEVFALEEEMKSKSSFIRRTRSHKASESDDEFGIVVKKQSSIKLGRQPSRQESLGVSSQHEDDKLRKKRLEKLEEEWDKDTPEVSLFRVMKANGREWWMIVLGILGSFILGTIFPAFAFIFGELLEVLVRPDDEILGAVHMWGGLFIGLGIISGLAVFFRSVFFTLSGENLTARLRAWSFKAILRQEIAWFDEERNSSGILTTRLAQDASQVQGATGTRLGTLLEAGFGLLLSIVIAFVFSWMLTLVLFGFVPVFMIAGYLETRALVGHAKDNKKTLEQAGKIAVDSMDNIRTVASLGVEPKFFNMYTGELKRPYRRSQLNSGVYGTTYGFSQSIQFLGFSLALGFGAYQVMQEPGHIAYARFSDIFTVFMAVIFGAIGSGQATSFAPNYAKAKLSANRIFSLLDREPVIDGYSPDGLEPEKYESELKLNEVKFNYPARPDIPVLQGLSVSVSPGRTLALVGPSGCGKSTVVSLIERFYDPQGGNLSLHDNDLRDLNIRWLRSQIGIVSQEPVLFDTSIADNIRYGANFREVSEEEVLEAAKAANIHNFIQSLPQGYATNVGSKGTQLSGGQKQRIAIARALVRDPKILLLDEATSALDTESEKIVQEALDKAREGRTTIVIAHRLSTIYNSDCIAVISKGIIVEKGTHTELMQKKGIYYRLNQYQLLEKEDEALTRSLSMEKSAPTINV